MTEIVFQMFDAVAIPYSSGKLLPLLVGRPPVAATLGSNPLFIGKAFATLAIELEAWGYGLTEGSNPLFIGKAFATGRRGRRFGRAGRERGLGGGSNPLFIGKAFATENREHPQGDMVRAKVAIPYSSGKLLPPTNSLGALCYTVAVWWQL